MLTQQLTLCVGCPRPRSCPRPALRKYTTRAQTPDARRPVEPGRGAWQNPILWSILGEMQAGIPAEKIGRCRATTGAETTTKQHTPLNGVGSKPRRLRAAKGSPWPSMPTANPAVARCRLRCRLRLAVAVRGRPSGPWAVEQAADILDHSSDDILRNPNSAKPEKQFQPPVL